LDTRSQLLRRLNEGDQEGTTISSTPEIRLEGDECMTPTTSTKFDALSNDCSAPTTLLPSKSIALGRASQNHASALLRLLYIHASINPGNLSPYVPSLLLPLYTALVQEVDPEDLAHVEADSFWLFEAFVAEFAELEDEISLEIWLKRLGDQLRQKDPQFLEQLVRFMLMTSLDWEIDLSIRTIWAYIRHLPITQSKNECPSPTPS
jgi:hypothetical protein